MALTACPDCGKSISTLAAACPSCGRPRDVDPESGGGPKAYTPPLQLPTLRRWRKPLLITLAVAVALVVLIPAADTGDPVSEQAMQDQPVAPLPPPAPVSPAEARVALAVQLQEAYASSMLRNYDIRFQARGKRCDILHVEAHGVNLYREMMEALAYGQVLYGQIVPGGVNEAAFAVGFETVVVTNAYDRVSASFGAAEMSRNQVRQQRRCTEATAAAIGPDP